MKAYLISPDERAFLTHAGDRHPLSILYLAAALETNGIETKCFDLNHTQKMDAINQIGEDKPDYVCLTALTPSAKQMQEVAKLARMVSPLSKIVFGGFHSTNSPGTFDCDHEIRGYGENQLVNLMTGKKEEFDIDRYPIPFRGKLNHNYDYKIEGLPAVTMITSRGCPFNCSFCSNFDKTQKRRNLENIAEELDIIKKMGKSAVYFLDDTFALSPNHVMNVGRLMKERGLKYRVETRANINTHIIRMLADSGCIEAGIGIESGDDAILQESQKGTKKGMIRQAVWELSNAGIKTKGFFIIGLPGETLETAYHTLSFAEELRDYGLNYADFYPLMPFPGSPVGDNPEKYGIEILEKDYSKYVPGGNKVNVVCQTKDLKAQLIKELVELGRKQWKN